MAGGECAAQLAAPVLLSGIEIKADYATSAAVRLRTWPISLFVASGLATGLRCSCTTAPNTPECLYGIWWAGAAAIPINAKLHAREAALICDNAEPLAFVDDLRRAG